MAEVKNKKKNTSSKNNSQKRNNSVAKNTNKKKNTTNNKNTNRSVKKSANKSSNSKNDNNIKKQETKTINVAKAKTLDLKKDNIKEILDEEVTKKNKNILKKIKIFFSKISKLSTSIKVLLVVGIICFIVLGIEGLLYLDHKEKINNSIVYHDSYNGLALDSDDLVVVGSSDFKHSKNNSYTGGNTQGKLIKYDSKGNIIFEIKYERGISSTFNSVITVSDGYVVVGTGIFSEEEKNNEAQEAIILKYDKDGSLVWEKFYQVLTNTSFSKVIEIEDGYVAVGQSIYANTELGNHTTGGGIIVKYNKDGKEVWHNNHGGTKSGNFNDIVCVDGDFYVAGKDGADSANIVKFNSKGEYKWHKNYSYTDYLGFTGIAYLDDAIYVVGSKKILADGIGDNDDRSTTDTDALFIKYDLNGNILFEKTFGGSSFERYNSIYAYHNNFYIVGHICSNDGGLKVITDDTYKMTGLIVRYDKNGNILKKEALGGSNNDNLTDITTDGISFYVVGYSDSKDGNISTGSSNGKDFFGKVIKLNNKFKRLYVK